MGWITITDDELNFYHEQNTLAGTVGAETEDPEPLGDYVRLHTLTGFPKYTLFVSTTFKASAGTNHPSEFHLDDDRNAQIMSYTEEYNINPIQDEVEHFTSAVNNDTSAPTTTMARTAKAPNINAHWKTPVTHEGTYSPRNYHLLPNSMESHKLSKQPTIVRGITGHHWHLPTTSNFHSIKEIKLWLCKQPDFKGLGRDNLVLAIRDHEHNSFTALPDDSLRHINVYELRLVLTARANNRQRGYAYKPFT